MHARKINAPSPRGSSEGPSARVHMHAYAPVLPNAWLGRPSRRSLRRVSAAVGRLVRAKQRDAKLRATMFVNGDVPSRRQVQTDSAARG